MGTKDGSNQMETADCDREATLCLGGPLLCLPRLKLTSAGWQNGNRKRRWLIDAIGLIRSRRQKPGVDTGAAAAQAFEIFNADAKPSLPTAQYAHDFGDLVFLKESDRGDARGASLEAGANVI